MARKAQPTKEDPKVEAAAGAEAETPEAPAEATQAAAGEMAHATEQDAQQPEEEAAEKPKPKTVSQPATRARMVDAKLKARHCRGGTCKEAGETMRMTAGEYQRLKKHGRVE